MERYLHRRDQAITETSQKIAYVIVGEIAQSPTMAQAAAWRDQKRQLAETVAVSSASPPRQSVLDKDASTTMSCRTR